MHEPCYAAHERMLLRRKDLVEGSTDHVTYSLYEQLAQHVIRSYPEFGPLRSVALRKISESLNDILDHAELVRLRARHSPAVDAQVDGAGASGPEGDVGGSEDNGVVSNR